MTKRFLVLVILSVVFGGTIMSSNSQPLNSDGLRNLLAKHSTTIIGSEIPEDEAKAMAAPVVMTARRAILAGSSETIAPNGSGAIAINVVQSQNRKKSSNSNSLTSLIRKEIDRQKVMDIRDAEALAKLMVDYREQELKKRDREVAAYRSGLSDADQKAFDQEVLQFSRSLTASKTDYLAAAQELPNVFFDGLDNMPRNRADLIKAKREG